MAESSSSAGSWSRNSVLWVQVATMLHHGPASESTTAKIRTELFNPRLLDSVGISATADGYRVAKWVLRIDWQRHIALLNSKRIVAQSGAFREDQTSYALHVFIELIEEYFLANPTFGRGWNFSTNISFSDACQRIDVASGRAMSDHPSLVRQDGLAIPGLEEASVEIFGIDSV